MPILSYFTVVGAVLLGLLLWSADSMKINAKTSALPFSTAQTVGLPAPYKAPASVDGPYR